MAEFVGRQRDLERLDSELQQVRDTGNGAFVWMRGRRRVGKSRLVEFFAQRAGVPYIFYRAPRRESAVALSRFAEAVAESTAPAAALVQEGTTFNSWVAALRAAATDSQDDPVMIIIDEFPYLMEHDSSVDADFQEAWDRHLQDLPVVLIAIGSDVSMMEALTEYGRALHDRPTREIVVPPFTPSEMAELLGMEAAPALDAYLIVGGFPTLAVSWKKSWSRIEYLEHALAESTTPFVVNAERILSAEFKEELQAREVLEAIGAGERTFANISSRSGVSNQSSLAEALDTLVTKKRVVREALPYAAPPGKKQKRYTVADPYLRFWLRFIGSNGVDEIERGRSDLVIARIEEDWTSYRGKAIEPLVQDGIERMLPDERFGKARYVGSYWTRTNDPEVDLVGAAEADPDYVDFVGSIKWRERSPFTNHDARHLAVQQPQVPGADKALLLGVSRAGFNDNSGLDVELGPEDIIKAYA